MGSIGYIRKTRKDSNSCYRCFLIPHGAQDCEKALQNYVSSYHVIMVPPAELFESGLYFPLLVWCLQWMTAGRGILHAEMPCSEEPAHGLQLWVNLRSSEKMVEPQYQELKSKEIPKPSKDGVTIAVISGEALGIKVSCAAMCL